MAGPAADRAAAGQPESQWWGSAASFQLAEVLKEIQREELAGLDFTETCEDCMEALRSTCSVALCKPEFRVEPFDWTPDVRLETFGSTRQGTALRNSDLDVRMTFEQFEVHGQQRQLRYLRGVAASPGDRFKVVQLVDSRLPLLRLRFDDKLNVDLTMGGTLENGAQSEEGPGIDPHVTALLAAAVDPEVARSFVRLVKAFARANRLVDAHGGYPSSSTWTLLALNFLQLDGCLPPGTTVDLQRPEQDDGGEQEEDVEGQTDERPRQLWPICLRADTLCRFFAFIERCGERPTKVSVSRGRSWPQATSYSGAPAPPLFIQHPGLKHNGLNIAISLSEAGWHHSVKCCAEARRLLCGEGHTSKSDASQEAMVQEVARRLFDPQRPLLPDHRSHKAEDGKGGRGGKGGKGGDWKGGGKKRKWE